MHKLCNTAINIEGSKIASIIIRTCIIILTIDKSRIFEDPSHVSTCTYTVCKCQSATNELAWAAFKEIHKSLLNMPTTGGSCT